VGGKISIRIFTVLALAVAVGLAVAVSPFASASPDGLNKVAEKKGFTDADATGKFQTEDSPIPGYAFPGIDNEKVAKGTAGFVGTLGVFAVGYGLAFVLGRRRRARGDDRGPTAATA